MFCSRQSSYLLAIPFNTLIHDALFQPPTSLDITDNLWAGHSQCTFDNLILFWHGSPICFTHAMHTPHHISSNSNVNPIPTDVVSNFLCSVYLCLLTSMWMLVSLYVCLPTESLPNIPPDFEREWNKNRTSSEFDTNSLLSTCDSYSSL